MHDVKNRGKWKGGIGELSDYLSNFSVDLKIIWGLVSAVAEHLLSLQEVLASVPSNST